MKKRQLRRTIKADPEFAALVRKEWKAEYIPRSTGFPNRSVTGDAATIEFHIENDHELRHNDFCGTPKLKCSCRVTLYDVDYDEVKACLE